MDSTPSSLSLGYLTVKVDGQMFGQIWVYISASPHISTVKANGANLDIKAVQLLSGTLLIVYYTVCLGDYR